MTDYSVSQEVQAHGNPAGWCEWCRDAGTEDVQVPENLCDMHAAEYDGVSEVQLDRQREAEWLDML